MKKQKNFHTHAKGFTLFEMLVYIALLALVAAPALSITWIFIQDHIYAERLAKIDDDGAFVLGIITEQGKKSKAINGATIFNTNPGKLVLTLSTNDTVTIESYQKTITQQSGVLTITKLRFFKNNETPVDITSDMWTVKNFTLQNLSSTKAATIGITLGLTSANQTLSKPYAVERTFTTSLTLWP